MPVSKVLIFFLNLFFLFGPQPAAAAEPAPLQVRVALFQEADSVRITILAPCRVTDLQEGTVLAEWPDLKWAETAATDKGVRVGQSSFDARAVVLEPVKPNVIIRVNAQPYRGRLILSRTAQGKLLVVDQLPLEDYLAGALTSEVSSRWPLESLKAHAVASRTMTAHRIWIRKNEPFDMTADTSTHLYHGVTAETGRTRQAVDQTAGQVLVYKGELFSATFHANCGGHTEDAAELWSMKGKLPPLKGVPDPYCKGLKHYRWHAEISKREWDQALGKTAQEIGELVGADASNRNRSGRVRSIDLTGVRGSAVITGRRLRELLGANRLRSLNFDIVVGSGKIFLSGRGWGHGVGLCQWGAYGMARQGRKMGEILTHYFPGAQQRQLKGLPGF